jgi:hypothetical protein
LTTTSGGPREGARGAREGEWERAREKQGNGVRDSGVCGRFACWWGEPSRHELRNRIPPRQRNAALGVLVPISNLSLSLSPVYQRVPGHEQAAIHQHRRQHVVGAAVKGHEPIEDFHVPHVCAKPAPKTLWPARTKSVRSATGSPRACSGFSCEVGFLVSYSGVCVETY